MKNIHWKYNTLPINAKVRIQSTGKATENLKITSKLDPTTGEDFDLEMAIKVVIFHETGELPDLPSHVDAGI